MPLQSSVNCDISQSGTTAPPLKKRTPHQWLVLKGVNKGHAVIGEDEECRPRPDLTWVRPDAARVRVDLTGGKLWDAVEWMAVRKREPMSPTDQETLNEMHVRTWGFHDINRRRGWYDPAWLDSFVPSRREGGYRRFLQILLSCYRSGAAGAYLGYHDCRALCDVGSDSTWRRWSAEMEKLGLIRMVQTWVEDTGPTARNRKYGKLLYCLGPAFHREVGVGLLEGIQLEGGKGQPTTGWARRAAKEARHSSAADRTAKRASIWGQRNARRAPSFNSSSILQDHNPSLRSGSEVVPVYRGREEIKDGASRVAFLASPVRSNNRPPATSVPTEPTAPRGAKRVVCAEYASSEKPGMTPKITSMLEDLMKRLGAASAVFIFFGLSTLIGCRENHHMHEFDAEMATEIGNHDPESGGSSSSSATAVGSGSGTGEFPPETSESGPESDHSTASSDPGTGEFPPETSESGAEGDPLDDPISDPCVFQCHGANNSGPLTWCRELLLGDEDLARCESLAIEAVLLQCVLECEWCR